jgi:predicted nucleotidyltransferase
MVRTLPFVVPTAPERVEWSTLLSSFRRSTAGRLVANFLQRVEEVNGDPSLLYWIDEVIVFGSFLTESEMLGDVDLAVSTTCRIKGNDEYHKLRKARVEEARARGRTFQSFYDELSWAQREIILRLRNRSNSLSIHHLELERTFIETLPHRQVYLRAIGPHATDALEVQYQTDNQITANL